MQNEKISVLMCVFNGEKTVGDAIESILDQTYKNFEFIIVDDGSTDNTAGVINQYLSQDRRIKLIKKNNEGLTKSLNHGLKYCHGKYIARQDADDTSNYYRLENSLDFLKEEKVSFVTTRYQRFNSFGKLNKRPHFFLTRNSFSLDLLKYGNLHAHGSFFFDRKIIDEGLTYDESFRTAQDFDFLLSVIKSGYKCKILSDCLYNLRIDDNSISSRNRTSQNDNAANILKKHGLEDKLTLDATRCEKLFKFSKKIMLNFKS